MAKIKWSAIGITNASGKSGGSVFSHNRGGAYVRRWAKPVNRQSAQQTIMRSIFSAVTRAWGFLSPEEVTAWNQYGLENPKTDVFGDSRPQTGFNAFVAVNQNRLHGGFPSIAKMPLPKVEIPAIISQEFLFQENGLLKMVLNLDKKVLAGDNIMLSIAFAQVNANQKKGYGSVKNKFTDRHRFQLVTTGATTTADIMDLGDPDFIDFISEMVSGLGEGGSVFTQIHLHTASGDKTNPVTNQTFITSA